MSHLPSTDGSAAPPVNESSSNGSAGTDASNQGAAPAAATAESAAGVTSAAEPVKPAAEGDEPRRSAASILVPTIMSLLLIGITFWLILAWSGYSTKYSQATDSWKLNSTKMIEITVVKEDRDNLACSSDVTIGGLHCGYHANQQPWGGEPATDSQVLQPFNTVANELFLAAGLWTSPGLPKVLPGVRFTVMCNYRVLGAAKSMSLRWALKGSFDPLKTSVAVGSLSDCVIPE